MAKAQWIGSLLLTLAIPSLASSPVLPAEFITPQVQEALGEIEKAAQQWTQVSMRVSRWGDSYYDVSEGSLGISLRGSRDSSHAFHFSGSAGNEYLTLTATPVSSQDLTRGFNVWGTNLNLSLQPSGSGFQATGWVDGQYWHVTISRSGQSYYHIWGTNGLNLSANSYGGMMNVSGSLELARFGKKSVAVLGAALAVVDSLPDR